MAFLLFLAHIAVVNSLKVNLYPPSSYQQDSDTKKISPSYSSSVYHSAKTQ